MLTYAQVNEADLSGIQQAAQEWRQLRAAYEGLGERYENQVRRRLRKHWEGKAATSAGHTIVQNKEQISAAAGEAGRMSKLLGDIHHDLDQFKRKLHKFEDGLAEHHLRIDAQGQITDHHPTRSDRSAQHDGDYDRWVQGRNQLIQRKNGDLQQILKAATEADVAAAASLRADNNGEDDQTFNKGGHQTLDEAIKAQRDAQHASDLLNQGGRLSPTQIDELSTLLEKNGQDPVFAQKFAQQTGARGTLDNYMTLMNPHPTDGRATKAQLRRLQKSLGTTLGTATRVDDPAMDKFQRDLLAENGQHFDRHSGPGGRNSLQGYQITASLMRHGEWDDETLKSFGNDLVKYENDKVNFFGAGRESAWPGNTHDYGLIDQDPMTGFMDGLGHNPDAATDFLSGKTTGTDDGDIDNLDYLMKDREWHGGGEDKASLGHALNAATTGHAFDQPPDQPPEPHTQQQAGIFEEVVNHTSEDLKDGGDFAKDGMGDSLGKMAAEYMPEINRAYVGDDPDLEKNLLLGNGGHDPDLDPEDTSRFLYQACKDPEGYGAVVASEQKYSADLMEHHLKNPDQFEGTPQQSLRAVSEYAGGVEGIAASARNDAVVDEQVASDKQFNEGLKTGGEVAKGVISVGSAAGGVPGAAAGAAGNFAVDQLVSGLEQDNSGEAGYKGATDYGAHEDATKRNLQGVVDHLQEKNPGLLGQGSAEQEVNSGVTTGYTNGSRYVEEHVRNTPDNVGQ
ncbi:hypothetical protein K378_00516 [Streptomyces sp. Amel2xB2]|uniref:DUF6571 family protein n=1 Tax=Streptomyces sp. Amel2xB2 TaxID=1305829 RepID=UPI000DBA5503|nr:DUF6571 family protein [Streptomyces sp. Amel2xB2]RAJ71696.1 hypothetical protein K378_00516 [Streptomyces sp. Amel2xB2]